MDYSTKGRRRALLSLLAGAAIALIAAACSLPSPTPVPTITPLPFAPAADTPVATAAPTAQATATAEPRPSPSPSASPLPAVTAVPSPAPTATPTPEPTPTPAIAPELRAQLRKIEETVSKARGLALDGKADPRFLTREELDARYRQRLHDSGYLKDMADMQDVLVLFGVLDDGQDLAKLVAGMEGQNILGFFDPASGELVIVGESGKFGGLEEMTFAHEFTHALQQQHFSIKEMADRLHDDSEAAAGLEALIEGDATLSMLNYAYQKYSPSEIRGFYDQESAPREQPPRFLEEKMQFPYQEGLLFVTSLYQNGGWKAVDRAYASPPASTEQVLHADKYARGEKPHSVDLPDLAAALGEGWEQRREDIIGEFDLRLILEEQLPPTEAARAAAGWGGDRFLFLRGADKQVLLVSLISWDTQKDAAEFFTAYEAWLRKGGIQPGKQSSILSWSTGGRESQLRLRGDRTLLVTASSGKVLEQVLALFPDS